MNNRPTLACLRQTSCYLITTAIFSISAVMFSTIGNAAVIAWGTPTTISGDTDVKTNGTHVYAYNFGSFDTTRPNPSSVVTSSIINGVTFTAADTRNLTSVGGGNISYDTNQLTSYNAVGVPTGTTFSNEYKALLSTVSYVSGASNYTMTLNNLTKDQTYQVQIWANYSNGTTLVPALILNGNAGKGLLAKDEGKTGSLGQYIVGTFTADGTSQSFTVTSTGTAYINGISLRAIAVPEPHSIAVVGLLVTCFALSRRRPKAYAHSC
jgi:hypothetical protein